jgi:tetratricopeptide (TPR) repeat protein
LRFQLLIRGAALALLLVAAWAVRADARNPHCSGGILYVTQAIRDRDKGDKEGYERQIRKAVMELEQGTTEDPGDAEAMGYLAWAYAEVDSACSAGKAFAAAITGLTAKGDKKKADWATGNRHSYWVRAFNDGIEHIRIAQQVYPDYLKKPADEAETTMKGEAEKHYKDALGALTRASCLKPGDPQTMRNLGSVHAFKGEFKEAEAIFQEGLKAAPADSGLAQSLKAVRSSFARGLVAEKKFDEAIAYFSDQVKAEPTNSENYLSLGEAYFARAQTKEGDARKADFKLAGDAYAKAAELKPTDPDLPFNAALAYQNAGVWDRAEAMWRLASKIRPDDVEILASLGSVLAEQKKYVEAIKVVHGAVLLKPQNKTLHRQLGSVYTKAGNNGKATEELMIYLAMQSAQPAPDPAAAAKTARPETAAGKTLASEGTPEQVITWSAEKDTYDTWFYWAKKRAYTFKVGNLVTRSDWSAADLTVTAAAGTDKK